MNKKNILIKLIVAVAIGILGTAAISSDISGINEASAYSNTDPDIQADIAKKILRFHVIANSDSEEDQSLKLKVKDAVVEYLKPLLSDTMTLDESESVVNAHLSDILDLASAVISENGYEYSVSGEITECYFPVKSYGDIVLPAGNYTAFRITIGNADGKNWWCILYPPLCFVDASYGIVPDDSKSLLKNVLDEDEYISITEAVDNGAVEIRFKLWDTICGWFS